jgi:cytochrome b involved in lipid metabolism
MTDPNEHLYLYIFEGKVYNLKDWIMIHPGGSLWFCHAYGRDITNLIYSYHIKPELCKNILAKYETKHDPKKVLHRYFNVPEHVLPEGFNAATDSLVFDWKKEDTLMNKVKSQIYTKEF